MSSNNPRKINKNEGNIIPSMFTNKIEPLKLGTSKYKSGFSALGVTGLYSGNLNTVDDNNSEYAERELGFTKQIFENNNKLFALESPAAFIHSANMDIQKIGNELGVLFNSELIKQYNRGLTIEKSREAALNYIKKIRDDMFERHNKDFPPEHIRIAGERIQKQNRTGHLRN